MPTVTERFRDPRLADTSTEWNMFYIAMGSGKVILYRRANYLNDVYAAEELIK